MTTGRIGLLLAGAAVVLGGCANMGEVSGSTPQAASLSAPATPATDPVAAASPAPPAPPKPAPASVQPAAPAPIPPAPRTAPPAPAPPSAPDYPTAGVACEDGLERVDELGALGADCDTARRVAAAVDTKILLLGEVPLEPFNATDGWVCSKERRQLEEYVYIACDRGDPRMESVTFGWGT